MGRKIIGFVIGMLVVTILLPSIAAAPTFGNKKEIFRDCYIEATGAVEPSGGSLFRYVCCNYLCRKKWRHPLAGYRAHWRMGNETTLVLWDLYE